MSSLFEGDAAEVLKSQFSGSDLKQKLECFNLVTDWIESCKQNKADVSFISDCWCGKKLFTVYVKKKNIQKNTYLNLTSLNFCLKETLHEIWCEFNHKRVIKL